MLFRSLLPLTSALASLAVAEPILVSEESVPHHPPPAVRALARREDEARVDVSFSFADQTVFDSEAVLSVVPDTFFPEGMDLQVKCRNCSNAGSLTTVTPDLVDLAAAAGGGEEGMSIRFDFGEFNGRVELEVVGALHKTFFVPLYAFVPAVASVDFGPAQGNLTIAFGIELEIAGAVDFTTGFTWFMPNGSFYELDLMNASHTQRHFTDMQFDLLPFEFNDSDDDDEEQDANGIAFSARAQLRAEFHADVAVGSGNSTLGANTDAVVFVNVAQVDTKLNRTDECRLLSTSSVNANAGASVRGAVQIPLHEFDFPGPNITKVVDVAAFETCLIPVPEETNADGTNNADDSDSDSDSEGGASSLALGSGLATFIVGTSMLIWL